MLRSSLNTNYVKIEFKWVETQSRLGLKVKQRVKDEMIDALKHVHCKQKSKANYIDILINY